MLICCIHKYGLAQNVHWLHKYIHLQPYRYMYMYIYSSLCYTIPRPIYHTYMYGFQYTSFPALYQSTTHTCMYTLYRYTCIYMYMYVWDPDLNELIPEFNLFKEHALLTLQSLCLMYQLITSLQWNTYHVSIHTYKYMYISRNTIEMQDKEKVSMYIYMYMHYT